MCKLELRGGHAKGVLPAEPIVSHGGTAPPKLEVTVPCVHLRDAAQWQGLEAKDREAEQAVVQDMRKHLKCTQRVPKSLGVRAPLRSRGLG